MQPFPEGENLQPFPDGDNSIAHTEPGGGIPDGPGLPGGANPVVDGPGGT